MTLKDYILRWQEVYDKNQSRPTTYAAHGYLFKNHILPGLGEILLSELTAEQVGDFLEERRRFGGHRPESPEYPGLGEHTMRHIHRLLQQCLDQAIRDGLISDNLARAFHYPKPKKVSANVLTPAEVEDYLDAAERLGHKIVLESLTCYESNLCTTAGELAQALDEVGSPALLGMCDVVPPAASGEPVENYLDLLGDRLAHLHLVDSDGRSDSHLLPGDGALLLPELLRDLSDRGYRGRATIELVTAYLAEPALHARRALERVRAMGV